MRLQPAVLACLLVALPAAAADKQRVAMFPVRAEPGVAQGTANLLGEVIAADAARSARHQLLTANDVSAALSLERQRQLIGCSDDTACLAEIGNALGAELLLDVSVGAIGNLRVLAMRLVDARQGKALRRESETVAGDADLVAAAHRLTAKLFDLPPPGRGRKTPGFAVLGGAGALAVTGAVFGVLANGDYQAFRADPFNDPLGDRAKTRAWVADGFYVGALVAAGVATFLLLTDQPPGEAPAGAGGGR